MPSVIDKYYNLENWIESGPSDFLNPVSDSSPNSPLVSAWTPQWVIRNTIFFESLIDGYDKDSAPCLFVKFGVARLTTYDSTREMSANGKAVMHPVVVRMKYGSWAPLIQEALAAGKNVSETTIYRFASVQGVNVAIQEYVIYDTTVIRYEQIKDEIVFLLVGTKYDDICCTVDKTGAKIGNTSVQWDLGISKVEAKDE